MQKGICSCDTSLYKAPKDSAALEKMGWSVVLVVFTLATLSSIDSSVISTMDFAVHPGQVVFSDSSTASQTCGEHTRFGACLWRCLDRSADCTGVVLDRTTGCCAVFSDPPDVDKNGRILLGPVESTKISGYKGKNLTS